MKYNPKIERSKDITLTFGFNDSIDHSALAVFVGMVMR